MEPVERRTTGLEIRTFPRLSCQSSETFLNPCLGITRLWRLIIFEVWPRRKPFSGAEKPPIAFICELKKQVRVGPIHGGEGQFAISDRAKAAHGNSNPNATKSRFLSAGWRGTRTRSTKALGAA